MKLAKAVVVVPAHNEMAHLPRCLRALATSAVCLPVPVLTVVVLDATDDGSDRLVGEFGPDVHFVEVDAGNVLALLFGPAQIPAAFEEVGIETFGDFVLQHEFTISKEGA